MTGQQDLPTIGYASVTGDDAAVARWLRRVVGWAAVAYGGGSGVAQVHFIAISRKWVEAAVDFGGFTAIQDAITWALVGAYGVVFVAGVLILRAPAAGIVALRIGAGLAILATYGEQVRVAVMEPAGFHWRAFNVMWALSHSVLPALLIALTLGPLGRTLRRG
jgi:hypothetical protein